MPTNEEAAAARRAYAEAHGARVQGVGKVEERSLSDVLHDPYVSSVIVNAGTAAVGAIVKKVKGSGGQAEPPPPADDEG